MARRYASRSGGRGENRSSPSRSLRPTATGLPVTTVPWAPLAVEVGFGQESRTQIVALDASSRPINEQTGGFVRLPRQGRTAAGRLVWGGRSAADPDSHGEPRPEPLVAVALDPPRAAARPARARAARARELLRAAAGERRERGARRSTRPEG